jgi:tetratricopeptide (TPR) repeat protein
MFFAGKKRRPIWQPSRFERLRRAFSANVHVSWKHLLAALLLLFFAGVVLPELLRPVVLVDPLSVPKLLEEQGLTGQVVAAEVADRIASMEEAVESLAPKDQLRLSSDSSVPDVEVPETKLSVRSVIQLLQVVLHRQPPHIHADIVCLMPGCTGTSPPTPGAAPSERLEVIYRFTDGKALFVHKRFRAIDIDDAVAKLSKLVLSQVNPYVMGRYADEIDHDPAAAVQILESCARNKDCTLRGWAFNKWGNVLSDQGKMDEAIAKYQKAIELDPKDVFPYDNWGRALQLQGKLDEAVAKCRRAIELNPKDAFCYNNWAMYFSFRASWMRR